MKEEWKELLEDKKVTEEINRHLWIESEKVGRDIGFEQAKKDWLDKYADAWIKHHMPQAKKTRTKRTTVSQTRRASSYYDKS